MLILLTTPCSLTCTCIGVFYHLRILEFYQGGGPVLVWKHSNQSGKDGFYLYGKINKVISNMDDKMVQSQCSRYPLATSPMAIICPIGQLKLGSGKIFDYKLQPK